MTSRTAAVYGFGGVLLVACLAAANMPQDASETPARAPRTPHASSPDALATDVSVQAARLHDAMAQAPVPGVNLRNPFAFHTHGASSAASTVRAAVAADEAAPPVTSPPLLTLMGVAEDTTPTGPRRTAVIGGDGDTIYMVGEGDAVGDRYRVTKIGADAVELEDVLTKGYRRLALR